MHERKPRYLGSYTVADGADGIKIVQLFRWSIPARYLFLAVTLFEFFELETFPAGTLHHVFDACILLLFGLLLRIMGCSARPLIIYTFLAVLSWCLDMGNVAVDFVDIRGVFWLLTHVLLAVYLLRTLKRAVRITEADIAGAIAFYVMVGIVFANLYNMIVWYYPGALVSALSSKISYDQILYYSLMTQLTVGYGDIVPGIPLVRVVSFLQALFGVMYIAILISWMVSGYIISHTRRTP